MTREQAIKEMKAVKLYCCGTAWEHDRDTTNSGPLNFYTSQKALKVDSKCWEECGIIEISPTSAITIVKPKPISKWSSIVSGEEIVRQQAIYIPLAAELVALSKAAGNDDLAQSALTLALATLKRKKNNKKAK